MSFYDTIARYYDAENQGKEDDIALFLEVAADYGGPILDIGCGTGREMLPLADAGYEIHGIDNSPAMLARAERYRQASESRKKLMHLHAGDVKTIKLDKKFPLVLVPFNGLMHFHTQAEQLHVLKRLREWVTDDGLLVLDLPNSGEIFGTQDSDALTHERTFLERETGHMVMQMSHSTLDRTSQLLRITWIYDEMDDDGKVVRTFDTLVLYYFFPGELQLLLKMSGFEVEAIYGDTDYNPFEAGAERMIVFARPAVD